jgi:alpha-amylase/alpha-mannosidase (GH57 family)
MRNKPIKISLVIKWHLPFFRFSGGIYPLPVNRFRALNDFLGVKRLLEKYPALSVTFSLDAGTLFQIKEFAEGRAVDPFSEFINADASALDREEKQKLLNELFTFEAICKGKPRAFQKEYFSKLKIEEKPVNLKLNPIDIFDTENFQELQLFFIRKFFSDFIADDSVVKELLEREDSRFFAERHLLLERMEHFHREIYDFIREAGKSRKLEISSSPFYYPMIPLLLESGERVFKDVKNEVTPLFSEDMIWHLRESLSLLREETGTEIGGFIFPENGISEGALKLLVRQGIKYTVIDESVIRFTRGYHFDSRKDLYSPFYYSPDGVKELFLLVTDHSLEEKIHSIYPTMAPSQIEEDFSRHLGGQLKRLKYPGQEMEDNLVTLIIRADSFYNSMTDSLTVLDTIFKNLSESQIAETVLPGEYLQERQRRRELKKLKANTRYLDNFSYWSADEKARALWGIIRYLRLLIEEKKELLGYNPDKGNLIYELFYPLESGDWWLYMHEYPGFYAQKVLSVFIRNVFEIYREFDEPVTSEIEDLIYILKRRDYTHFPIRGIIAPTIDGIETTDSEWTNSIVFHCRSNNRFPGGDYYLKDIYTGFDRKNLYFRIDFIKKPPILVEFVFSFYLDTKIVVVCSPFRGVVMETRLKDPENLTWETRYLKTPMEWVDQFELALPRDQLDLRDENLRFQVALKINRKEVSRFPLSGLLEVDLSPSRNKP